MAVPLTPLAIAGIVLLSVAILMAIALLIAYLAGHVGSHSAAQKAAQKREVRMKNLDTESMEPAASPAAIYVKPTISPLVGSHQKVAILPALGFPSSAKPTVPAKGYHRV